MAVWRGVLSRAKHIADGEQEEKERLNKTMESITIREPEKTVLLTQELPNVPGKRVTLMYLNYPPGAADAAHRHPAFRVAYVLSGRIVSQVGDDPVRTYDTGEFYTETPDEAHEISRNASDLQPASVLALLISDIDAELVEPLVR
jgi:quercetin dioxygenase-like cupin family protein